VIARLQLRQSRSAPVLAQLRQKLLRWKEQLLPKHAMDRGGELCAEPVGRVNVFCSDGAVAIDNNASEREMKRVVLKRCKQGKRRTTLRSSMQLLARPSAGCRPNSARAEDVSVFFQSRFSANPSRRTPHGEEPCSLLGSVDSGGSKHPQ
jgi:Transposase IS66 family